MFGAHSVDSRRLQGGYGQKRGARAVKFPQIHLLTLEVSRSGDYRTLQARSNGGSVMIPAYGSSGCQCHPDLENKENHESENSLGLLPFYYFRV